MSTPVLENEPEALARPYLRVDLLPIDYRVSHVNVFVNPNLLERLGLARSSAGFNLDIDTVVL